MSGPAGHAAVRRPLFSTNPRRPLRSGASPTPATLDQRHADELPPYLDFKHWALAGEWTIGRENVVVDEPGGTTAYRFQARDAHLVLSPGTNTAIPFRVLVNGEAPGPSHGEDVDEEGSGLLRERTLEITFAEPGAEAYAFTFG
jgi:hypothetical protein